MDTPKSMFAAIRFVTALRELRRLDSRGRRGAEALEKSVGSGGIEAREHIGEGGPHLLLLQKKASHQGPDGRDQGLLPRGFPRRNLL